MKLFQIKNVHTDEVFKGVFWDNKKEAKEQRDQMNKDKHGDDVDYKDYTKHTFVVTYGHDHTRYQA